MEFESWNQTLMIVATTYIILNCVPVALKLQKYIRLLVLATTTENHQTLPLIREGAQQLFFVKFIAGAGHGAV